MILLLGATGYIGQAFATELRRRKLPFEGLSRKTLDYTDFDTLFDHVRRTKPLFIINAAGYTGRPNVDACESHRPETLQANATFPQMLSRVCLVTRTPWGHVSSGCIYSGARVQTSNVNPESFRGKLKPLNLFGQTSAPKAFGVPNLQAPSQIDSQLAIEKDIGRADLLRLFASHPDRFYGYTESDEPNFCFRSPPCSFYSGTKALAEEVLRGSNQCYIWRLRIPFDEFDHPRNYLSKIQHYSKVYNNVNSLSHRGDFVRACLDLWEKRAAFGTYNVTNPGAVMTRQVVDRIIEKLKPARSFEYWKNDKEFYAHAAKTPRSNCILDSSKLLNAGVQMRPIEAALDDALNHWQVTGQTLRMAAGLEVATEQAAFGWSNDHYDNAAALTQQWLRA